MVINRKIKRTVRANKAKYIGMILLIAISSALAVSFSMSTGAIQESVSNFMSDNNVEDAEFYLQMPLTQEQIDELESTFEVKIEERKIVDYSLNDDTTLRIFQENKKLNIYTILDGRSIKSNGEIIISSKFAEKKNLYIGDTLRINSKNYEIVGLYTSPDYLYPLKSENDISINEKAFGLGIISEKDFSKFESFTFYYSIGMGNEQDYQEIRKILSADNYILKWLSREDNQRISDINGTIDTFVTVGNTIPIGILIVVCILVAIMLSRLLKTEYIQIGMLSSFGYRKKEIMLHYIQYATFMSIVGSIIGIIPGIFMTKPISNLLNTKYSMPKIDIEISIITIIIFAVITLFLLLATTVIVVNKALKLTPLELMKGRKNFQKVGALEKSIKLNRFRFKTMFQIRELLRNIKRSITMIIGITFAAILLLFGFTLNDSLNYIINDLVDSYQYEYEYMFNTLQDSLIEGAERKSYINLEFISDNEEKYSFIMYGLERDSTMISLLDSNGSQLDYSNTVITKPLSEKLDVSVGDNIEVTESISGKVHYLTIDAITDTYIGEYIYVSIDKFNELLNYPVDSYMELISAYELDIDDSLLMTTLKMSDTVQGYENMMLPIKLLVGVMAIMTFIIGLIIIYILTVMLIEESSYNISLFKVFGYKNKNIYSLFINSTFVLVTIGYCLGYICIYPIISELFNVMSSGLGISIPVKLSLSSTLISFIIIIVTYYASKLMAQKKVIKISMVDALKERSE